MIKFSEIPIKLLQEAKPFIVTIETKNGEKYRGKLKNVEENMNILLNNVIWQEQNGKTKKFQSILLRGNSVKIIILPEILKEVPILNSISKN
mmetsp:Transcript_9833/g.19127  ORF Transcript_9833/g.19127 Transcript_9833/m.19127 type:complete len:92 (+) Transcript_9833:1158-1433(+)